MPSNEICPHEPLIKDLNFFNGNVDEFFNHLSTLFEDTFIKNTVFFNKKPIEISQIREKDGKLERFWHIVSNTDYHSHEKTFPNLRRCEAVYYLPILLQNCFTCDNFICFDRLEKNRLKTYIWCLNKKIMIVLENLPKRYRFITCFIVNRSKHDTYMQRYLESKT